MDNRKIPRRIASTLAYRAINDIGIPVVLVSRRGKIVSANAAAVALLGVHAGQALSSFLMDDSTGSALELNLVAASAQTELCRVRSRGDSYLARVTLLPGSRSTQALLIMDLHAMDLPVAFAKIVGHAVTHAALDETLAMVSSDARRMTGAVRCYIKYFDASTNTLVYRALSSTRVGERFVEVSSPTDRGITGRVFTTRVPYYAPDLSREHPGSFLQGFPETVSKLVLPLVASESPDADCYGVIAIDGDHADQFNTYTRHILKLLATSATIALTVERLEHDTQAHLAPILAAYVPRGPLQAARAALHHGKNMVRNVIADIDYLEDQLGNAPGAAGRSKLLKDRAERLLAVGDALQTLFDSLPQVVEQDGAVSKGSTNLRKAFDQASRLVPFETARIEVKFSMLRLDDMPVISVRGNPTDWMIIFYTLFSNSFEAIRTTGSNGLVSVMVEPSPGNNASIRVIIEDNGPGLPRSIRELLREGVSVTNTPGGSGFGVLNVSHTVRALGGALQLDSSYGRGTRYIIDVPIDSSSQEKGKA